jgi:hypothetical protein
MIGSEKLRKYSSQTLYFVLTSFLIILPAIWNRFPLVFFDSGTYIDSCFTLTPKIDRPIGYSLFMRIVSWQASMWFVVIFQALILNYLIIKFLKIFNTIKDYRFYHIPIVIVLAIFTGMGWYASQIMPDIFTAILGLSIFVLFFDKSIKIYELFLLSIFIFFSLISHYSHLVISILFLIFIFVFFFRFMKNQVDGFLIKTGLLSLIIALSFLFIAFYNYKNNEGFKISHSNHIFLNARLYGSGVLQRYLDENCHAEPSFLCNYKNELPDAQYKMLWSEESPINKEGLNWKEANKKLGDVNKRILKKPKYLFLFAFESLKSSIVQLTQVNVGSGIFPYIEGSSPYFNVYKYRRPDFIAYKTSRQNWDQLDFKPVNFINYFLHIVSLIMIVFVLMKKIGSPDLLKTIWFVLLFIITNAIVTASMSNVYDRTHARVSWLMVLVGFAIFPVFQSALKDKYQKS